MNKIYIFGPTSINSPWEQPFYIFAQSLSRILSKNNIPNRVVGKRAPPDLKYTDLALVFQPYYNDHIGCKIIYINSESMYIRKNICEQVRDINIMMVWDYQYKNINYLRGIASVPISYVPPLYHDFNEEHFIKENCDKKIDFLLYGSKCSRREDMIKRLSRNFKAIIYATKNVNELYEFINRSKIVIIIGFYANQLEIDFYRLSFLLSNKIFFISEEIQPEEREMREKLNNIAIFSHYNNFEDTCYKYIKLSQEERDKICEESYNAFKNNFKLEDYVPINDVKRILDNGSSNI